MNFKELEDSLIDVRKAYRLLYLYQKRVLDLMSFISSYYSLSFNGGWSKFSNFMPTKTRVKFNHWAWDWLNMYFYEFNFGLLDDKRTTFAILLQSDTGFFESNAKDKLDITNYKSSENSNTRIIFVCGRNIWGCPVEDFLNESLITKQDQFIKEVDGKDKIWVAKAYDLHFFLNKEETIKRLEDFRIFAKKYNINFPIKSTSFRF